MNNNLRSAINNLLNSFKINNSFSKFKYSSDFIKNWFAYCMSIDEGIYRNINQDYWKIKYNLGGIDDTIIWKSLYINNKKLLDIINQRNK